MDIVTQLATSNLQPHILLYGPAGSGKTACARTYAETAFAGRVFWIDAAFDSGVDVFRDTIQQLSKRKQELTLCVVDNADLLTQQCQQALRRIMEKQSHLVRFAFCAYGLGHELIGAIHSRCVVLGMTSGQ